jgi:hypothetical protein
MSSPTRRPSHGLANAAPGVEVTRAEVGTAGSPTPPFRVGARAAARALLPTTSTDPARVMARHCPAVESGRDPADKMEIRTAARRGWQSRQPKASGTALVGKLEARRRPDHRGRRSECAG